MILDEIVASKRAGLAMQKQVRPLEQLKEEASRLPVTCDFAAALRGPDIGLIAEVKKASPSKGVLAPHFDPVALATSYVAIGASAISVLTEERFFLGSLHHLQAVRSAVSLPILRKDFLFDPYQIYEARVWGADAILLICAMLDPQQLHLLAALAQELGLACLVEVHNEQETEVAVASGAPIIGINNRNLHTFEVDLETTERLRPLVPAGHVVVSESGIHSFADVERLRRIGIDAILVGEALVVAGSNERARLVEELRGSRVPPRSRTL